MEDNFCIKQGISDIEIQEALSFSCSQILHILPEFTEKFQDKYSVDGFYEPIMNNTWTTGFWTGQIWLAYEYCRNEELKRAGEIQMASFLKRIIEKVDVDHHDMGFLYSPSCVAGYKLTKSSIGKEAAIKAADQLLTRYRPVGEFLQAWGPVNTAENNRLIIDCLLNVPLLFWATEMTNDDKYAIVAQKHIKTALLNVIREDYSTWHTFYFDFETGKPSHGATCQGYRDGSAWARGQAWGIYGLALAYKYTKNSEYIDLFHGVANYYLTHLPKDMVPYWDLEFTDGSSEPRDSSSASIAACGFLEMSKYLNESDGKYYTDMAKRMMKSLYDHYAVKDVKESNGLVLHSTYSKKSLYNTCTPCGVDECNSWGDYFYMEALTRLHKDWDMYW